MTRTSDETPGRVARSGGAPPVDPAAPRHPIGVVCRRTGLKADLVRAWERRYGAVTPGRGATARRLYSDADIERLRLLHEATRGGRGIGQVARLATAQLAELVAADQNARLQGPASLREPRPEGAAEHLAACRAAVAALDPDRLRFEIESAAARMSRSELLEHVLVPLVHGLGDGWHRGELRPVHEHLATAVVRSFLTSLQGAYRVPYFAPTLVVATPAGQSHEIGALLVAAAAAGEGWYVSYLGPSLPAEDIAFGAHEVEARAVALSIVYPLDDPGLAAELRRLRARLAPTVGLLVGGRASAGLGAVLDEIGAVRPQGFDGLRRELERLRQPPPRAAYARR